MELFWLISFGATWLGHVSAMQGEQAIMRGGEDICHNACTELVTILPNNAFYGTVLPGFKESYFCARQREVVPACIVQPTSAKQVSDIVKTVARWRCPFAVKSGGHAMFPGGSSQEGGITVDLKNLDEIVVSEDGRSAAIGPGQRWGKVYELLEPMGLMVLGGRVSNVGVGGFLMGGGISFFSRKFGWASDNILNYELIMANGSISNINYESHPDLYWALRGGGGNYGIVTRFTLQTYPITEVWGGQEIYLLGDVTARQAELNLLDPFSFASVSDIWKSTKLLASRTLVKTLCTFGLCTDTEAYFDVFEKMVNKGYNEGDEDFTHLYMSMAYFPNYGTLAGSAMLLHDKAEDNPSAFKDLDVLKGIQTTVKINNITSITKDIDQWQNHGSRFIYRPINLRITKPWMKLMLTHFLQLCSVVAPIPGVFPALVMQPISKIASVSSHIRGGSPLAIDPATGPLMMFSITPEWRDAADDEAIQTAFQDFMEKCEKAAKEMGLWHEFVYMNYADKGQNVLAGYGETNLRRLREVQRRYDPEGVFGREVMPGHFKL